MRIGKENNSKKKNKGNLILEIVVTFLGLIIIMIIIDNSMEKLKKHTFSPMKIKDYYVKQQKITPTPSKAINSKKPVKHEKLMPTDLDIKRYTAAWNMFLSQIYQESYDDGYYTDSNLITPVRDFWSNGIYAEFDSDEDGNAEIILKVRGEKLVYVGILGRYDIFITASDDYKHLIGRTMYSFIEMCTTEEKTVRKSSDFKTVKDGKGNTVYQWTDEKGQLHSVFIEDEEQKK